MPLEVVRDPATGQTEHRLTPPRIITLDELVALDDVETKIVNVPQWGAAVQIKQFTKQDEYDMRVVAQSMSPNGEVDRNMLELVMVARAVIDPPLAVEHVGILRGKSMAAIDVILSEIAKINGGTEAAVASAEKQFLAEPGVGDGVPSGDSAGPDSEATPV